MTVSRQPQITEELLSAYLDDQVTTEERALVEAAIATDQAVAWQVDSLRQTVHLLQALPPLALPRSFSLEAILAEARAAEGPAPIQAEAVKTSAPPQTIGRTVARTPVVAAPENHWWQWFSQLWQGGNLQLRNAAAIALTLFFVLLAGDRLLVATRPVAEMTPKAAPVVLTSSITVKAPAIPTVEPTATIPASTVTANEANNSNQPASRTVDNVTANPPANTTAQAENATGAGARGGPGPVEPDLTGGSGPTADAPVADSVPSAENNEHNLMAKSSAPASAAVAATTRVTQGYTIAAEPPLTTAAIPAPMTATVTNTGAISVTSTITPAMIITSPVLPTPTVVSAAPMSVPPTVDGRTVWLAWAQMITALSTVVLAGLWWRSRR